MRRQILHQSIPTTKELFANGRGKLGYRGLYSCQFWGVGLKNTVVEIGYCLSNVLAGIMDHGECLYVSRCEAVALAVAL